MFTTLALCLFLASGMLYAQAGNDHGTGSNTQQNKSMTKQELSEAVKKAHRMVNLFHYRFAQDWGTDRDLQLYFYWLKQRQDLMKQYNEMKD
jgi:hypothetical protein